MLARMPPRARTREIPDLEAREADVLAMEHEVSQLQERIAELEFATEDAGWERLDESGTDLDLSKEMLRRIIRDSQIMYLKNPLIDHAVGVVSYYVFGQGVAIAGKGAANDRVQAFLSDRSNHRVLASQQALIGNDSQLTYEGNVFFALFGVGADITKVRRIPTLQMVAGDIIRNPEDDAEVWLYQRRWNRKGRDAEGRPDVKQRTDYYPALWFDPETLPEGEPLKAKPKEYGDGEDRGEVHWDTPVIHIRDGGLNGAKFGVPTTYSSLDWARAVSRDLSDYATIRRALARFAWKVIAKSRATASATARKLQTSVTAESPRERNPPPTTASTAIMTEGNDLQPLRTAGAAPSPEEGRRLWLMVAAGTGIPETILSGNAEVGNLATAKTLDRPTELMMKARQSLWADMLSDIIEYDLRRAQSANAVPTTEPDPSAPVGDTDLASGIDVSPALREVDLTPTVDFPDILEDDVVARVQAVVNAATLGASGTQAGTMPEDLLTRLLLTALGVDDVDEIVDEMFPPEQAGLPEVEPSQDPVDPAAIDPLGSPDAALLAVPAESRFAQALDAFATELAAGRVPGAPRARGRARQRRTAAPAAAR